MAEQTIKEKVELHVHLDGALRAETVLELSKKKNICLPSTTITELKQKTCVTERPGNFAKFLATFDHFVPCVVGDREAIWRMAYEFCEDCAAENTVYVEARYSPHFLANDLDKHVYAKQRGDLRPAEVVEIINKAFDKGAHDFGISVKSILCCMTHWPEWSLEVLALCEQYRLAGVVGIDLAGGELDLKSVALPQQHQDAFDGAYKLGIHRTVHAGETGDYNFVIKAVDDLRAERIGHGYHTLDNDPLYTRLRERGVHFEVCPNSSILTGALPNDLNNHIIKRFAADGVNFSINRDDPLPFDTDLNSEFMFAGKIGMNTQQQIQCIFNAAKSSFCGEEERSALVTKLTNVYGQH